MGGARTITSEVAATVLATVGHGWTVERLLPAGWQQGAWLVRHGHGRRAVLKVHTDEQDRVLAAVALIEKGRAAGWPTPAWLATGRVEVAGGDAVWVLQEYIDGERPAALDERIADHFIEAWEIQRALTVDGLVGWSEWVAGVVFEDWVGSVPAR